ncbi:MAG TPA: metallophosphoesterase [Vicinamibacterales bacterium]
MISRRPSRSPRLRAGLALLGAAVWAVAAGAVTLELPNAEGSLKFAVIGDSGSGSYRQYQVAGQMVLAHRAFPFEFVLMLGDNIYGRERPKDFVQKFERPYQPLLDAGVTFYAALGNHDEPHIQIHYKPFNLNGRRYHSFVKGNAEFFVVDSTFMSTEQLKWLEGALQASDAPWKIAYMHHPIYSSGKRHGSDVELRAFLEPLFVKYGVSVVFAGHEHFYERLKPQQGIAYFTVGSAGKLRAGNIRKGPLYAAGFDTDLSFMIVEIIGNTMHFQVISRTGETVDRGTVARREVPATATAGAASVGH